MAHSTPVNRRRTNRSQPIRVDVEDRGDTFVVSADLPGIRVQDVDVSARKNRVRIRVDVDESAPRGVRFGGIDAPFERVVTLPEHVRANRATASYEQGVLRVTLPKRTEHPRRSVRVEAPEEP